MQTGADSVFNYQIRVKKRILRSELMNRKVRANAVLTLGKLCLQVFLLKVIVNRNYNNSRMSSSQRSASLFLLGN